MGTASSGAASPVRIFDTLRGFQDTAALKTAIDLEVFTAIADGAGTAAEIAAKCGASERGMRILCDTLVADEFLLKHDGRYSNAADASVFLNRRSPAYMGGAAEFLCGPDMASVFTDLTECVRKGGTVMQGQGTVNPDNPIWVTFARAMAPMATLSARAIAAMLPATGPLKVLDIAAGHGMYGISIAQRNQQAQIMALDWKAVLEVAKENAGKMGVGTRLHLKPGSAFDEDFGSDYDVILLTNFLHHFDVETNEKLLGKVFGALKPGGKVITLEFVPEADRTSPQIPARFALTMLFSTARGDAYTFSELQAMYGNAGFASSEHHRLETQQSVIISTK